VDKPFLIAVEDVFSISARECWVTGRIGAALSGER